MSSLTITVVARGVDDVDAVHGEPRGDRRLHGLLSREERVNDDGQLDAVLETVYRRADRRRSRRAPAGVASAREVAR